MLNSKLISEALRIPSPITEIKSELLSHKKVQLFLKRDDLIHSEISGNKWRKLYLNLLEARAQNKDAILTFGGAFSNHIYATAAACHMFGFKSIGIIRGEYVDLDNPTLKFAKSKGMDLVKVSKAIYGSDKEVIAMQYPNAYIIPEGGNNDLGRDGMKFLAEEIMAIDSENKSLVVVPIGTACTMGGLVQHLSENYSVLGINVLKNKGIDKELKEWTKESSVSYKVSHDYHFGGYAKVTHELIDFANQFSETHQIDLDPIYTAKMMCGLFDLIDKNTFPEGQKIIAIHTGGLQGVIPYNQLNDYKLRSFKSIGSASE